MSCNLPIELCARMLYNGCRAEKFIVASVCDGPKTLYPPLAGGASRVTINGEKVWVPDCRRELIAGLKRMGIHKVAGMGLDKLSRDELRTAYCRERSRIVRRQQQECSNPATRSIVQPRQDDVQLTLFG